MGLSQPTQDCIWDDEVDARPKTSQSPSPRRRRLSGLLRPTSTGVWLKPIPAAPQAKVVSPARQAIAPFAAIWAALGMVLRLTWLTLTFPFRVIIWVLALLGRIAGLAIGFGLMVFGAALLPSPFLLIGLAVFVLGLVMTLRSVE